ncbi:MAG: glycosyltransferase family 2 protein [Chthoniobacteraceae bacterium]|jgi:glycosyltransferase involved in cell wall biosynthesis
MKVGVTVIVPAKNEARNLARCLASVQWADELCVVDSHSTDSTADIAAAHGARVVQFNYSGGWPKKKNWALENLTLRHPWVFFLDADETLPPEAEPEFRDIVDNPAGPDGYWINRRFLFMGRWMRHAYYPNWNLRLFRRDKGRFEKISDAETNSGDVEIHEHVLIHGPTARLRCQMDHYAFPSVEVFVEKHNRYSNWEARVQRDLLRNAAAPAITHPNVARRRGLRLLSLRLPFRPSLRFLYIYIWQRGFLDGREGYYFARLHAFYEFLCVAKGCELAAAAERGPR